MERNLLSKVTCLIIVLCWFDTNAQSFNSQRERDLSKEEYVADPYKVHTTWIRNCKLLEMLDSVMRSKQDSFPDRFWTKMPRIQTIFEERCDTTQSYGFDGEIIINHACKEPSSENIERIFEGRNPTNDIEIIFSPGICPNDYIIYYKNSSFGFKMPA